MRWMFSRMSPRQMRGSCLERTPRIPHDAGAKTRVLDWRRDQIDVMSQQGAELAFQGIQSEQAETQLGIDFSEQIDIAVCTRLTAGDRTEQRQMDETRGAQFLSARP